MPTNKNKAVRQARLGRPGQGYHLWNISQIVQGEANGLGLKIVQLAEVIRLAEDLQVEELHCMASGTHSLGDSFQPQGLESQVDFRVHQAAWVYQQDFHSTLLLMEHPHSIYR